MTAGTGREVSIIGPRAASLRRIAMWSHGTEMILIAIIVVQFIAFTLKLREKNKKIAELEADRSNPHRATGISEDIGSLLADQPKDDSASVRLPPDLKL
jgi:hypothetical protein